MTHSHRSLKGSDAAGRGFTLLEVLIALAIITIALGALLRNSAGQVRDTVYLRDKVFANWVASNKVAEFQLAKTWPGIGQSQGESDFGRAQWRWRAMVSGTAEKDLRRLEVSVERHTGDSRSFVEGEASAALTTIIAFLPKP